MTVVLFVAVASDAEPPILGDPSWRTAGRGIAVLGDSDRLFDDENDDFREWLREVDVGGFMNDVRGVPGAATDAGEDAVMDGPGD